MRDRLIEILYELHSKTIPSMGEIADHLIENGIVCPPCNVGDTVYIIGTFTKQIVKANVLSVWWSEGEMYLLCSNGVSVSVKEQLGKTVFLTKEEAEEHLQKGTN